MIWTGSPFSDWYREAYETWIPRFAILPHRCYHGTCGYTVWLGHMFSHWSGGGWGAGSALVWSCPRHAQDID